MKFISKAGIRSVGCTSFILLGLAAFSGHAALWGQTYPTQIGTEASDRPTGFIDAFKDQGRLTVDSAGNPVPTDASGNPLSDGTVVVFDDRPTFAWAPPIDDPSEDQPNMSGLYTLSFTGQAVLSNVAGNPMLTFSNQTYDAATNTTTVNVLMPGGPTYADGPALMVISFTNTQLTATSGTNTGFANLQVIRPGFTLAEAANPTQVYDPAFLAAYGPFAYIRFMGWLGTNQNPYIATTCASAAPACSTVNTPTIGWTQRSLPTDFYQGVGASVSTSNPNLNTGGWGISWEYVILLANATNKDIWVNVPINATGSSDQYDPTYVASPDTTSYVYNLAMLLKNGDAFTGNVGLNPGLHIYIEHSNEVWNSGFMQYGWNENAADAEVAAAPGKVSVLNNDGDTNSNDWADRRHIKRLYEIAYIFESVFGSGSFGTTIRPVYAWWQLDEGSSSGAANALAWFKTNYGAPANYFYAMAQGDYFSPTNWSTDTTIADVLTDMTANSNASVGLVTNNLATATQYGLKLAAYEGGPGNTNGGANSTTNLGVQILANRDPGMDTLVQTHIRNNWFQQGGDLFGYFAMSSAYSRYGDWGATDDYRNLTTAKYNALVNLTGYEPNGVPFTPGDLIATAGDSAVELVWQPVPGATSYSVYRGTAPGAESATAIGTVSTTTYSDTGLADGTTYYYVVTAANSTGTSASSNEASAMPVGVPPAAPVLSATAGNAQANLSWVAVAGAATYNVYQGSTSGGESSTPIATGITATTYTVDNLTNGTAYYFEVAAVNSYGTGAMSNEEAVTPVAPSFSVSGAPVSLAPGATTSNTSTVNLTPGGGFTGNVTLTAALTTSPAGAVDPPTFSFGTTSPVDITGSAAGTATLTISTTAATSSQVSYPNRQGIPWYAAGGATLACLLLFGVPARRRSWRSMLGMVLLLVALAGGAFACGGGSAGGGGGGNGNPGTTAGTYTITVTGTSGTITQTGTVTLDVQ